MAVNFWTGWTGWTDLLMLKKKEDSTLVARS
jgi:hypothetical protein